MSLNNQCVCGHQLADEARFCSRCGRSNNTAVTGGRSLPGDSSLAQSQNFAHGPAPTRGIGLFIVSLFVILSSLLIVHRLWQPAAMAHQEVPGEVRIAGGSNDNQILDSAELYNPVTGIFSVTGSMTTPRVGARAVLLNDGRVLVTGGMAVDLKSPHWAPLKTAELYDPHTGAFGRTADMNYGRLGHTATLLADGRVLVAGGGERDGAKTAEIYDPASASFTSTGLMNRGHEGHQAVLLQGGKVLIAGGIGGGSFNKSAEIYDPSSDSFVPTGDMIENCWVFSNEPLPNGQILFVGDWSRGAAKVGCGEIYDPLSGTFTSIAVPASVCGSFGMALLRDSSILLAGTDDTCNIWHIGGRSAYLYLPSTQSFRLAAKMNVARAEPAIVALANGRVFVAGGFWGATAPNSPGRLTANATAEIYDPTTNTFRSTGEMATPRGEGFAVRLR